MWINKTNVIKITISFEALLRDLKLFLKKNVIFGLNFFGELDKFFLFIY